MKIGSPVTRIHVQGMLVMRFLKNLRETNPSPNAAVAHMMITTSDPSGKAKAPVEKRVSIWVKGCQNGNWSNKIQGSFMSI